MSSLAEKEEQPQKPDEDEEQPAKKRARTDAAPVTDPEASDDAAPAPAPASGFAAHTSGGFGSFGGSSSGGFGSSSGGGFGGFSGGGFGGFGAAAERRKLASPRRRAIAERGEERLRRYIKTGRQTEAHGRFGENGRPPAAPEKIDASNGEEGDRSPQVPLQGVCLGEAERRQRDVEGAGRVRFKVLRDKRAPCASLQGGTAPRWS